MTTLRPLAMRHCLAARPALTLDGFAPAAYGITARSIRRIATGDSAASDQFLQRVAATHSRLFPTETLAIALPDNRVVHIDERGDLSITFPKTPNP